MAFVGHVCYDSVARTCGLRRLEGGIMLDELVQRGDEELGRIARLRGYL